MKLPISTTTVLIITTLVASLWRTCEASSSSPLIETVDDLHRYLDDHPDEAARLHQVVDLIQSQRAQQRVDEERELGNNSNDENHQLLRKLQLDGIGGLPTNILRLVLRVLELPFFTDTCGLVNDQFFGGDVFCTCTGTLLLANFEYTCPFEPICADDDEQFCTTPTYKGSVPSALSGAISLENSICASNITLFGDIPLGDLCVSVKLSTPGDQILSCEASFLDLACLTCARCPGGGFGIALQCLEEGEEATNCIGLPGFVSQASDPDNQIDASGNFAVDMIGVAFGLFLDAVLKKPENDVGDGGN